MMSSSSLGTATDELLHKEFVQARAMQSEAAVLAAMNLHVWSQSTEALPLELANVIANSSQPFVIVRRRHEFAFVVRRDSTQ